MRNKQILLSGRAVTTDAANVPADRYSFLHLSDAEPNLGTANANGWVLVYDTETPGNRLWSKNLITAYDHANSAYDSQNTTGNYANSAFLKANSAYESQNVTGTYANNAYTHANAANLQANSAYESQNVTGTYANNAYTHANAANLQANSAYESQNVTGTYANNAYLHSNAAFLKANSAYESQNVTGTYANNAYTHANAANLQANSAYESQNVTGTYANNAYTHANAAFLKANSAYESQNVTGVYANAAFLKSNSAYESQNVTGTYANNAYVHANSSYDSQNTTGVYANAAFLKANSAYESQNVTGIYANTAFEFANSAGLYANGAFTQANSAYVRANNSLNANTGGTVTGYINVTQNVSVGSYIDLNVAASNPVRVEGRIFYDNEQHALGYYNESDMTFQIGQEQVVRVWNNSGATITDGKVVRINGLSSSNGFPAIVLAAADTSSNAEAIGITTTTIPNGGYGYVTTHGKVNGLNTSLLTAGQELYLSDTPGEYQTTPPNPPSVPLAVGHVVLSDVTDGAILVRLHIMEGKNKTNGAILFARNGAVDEDPSKLYWDYINNRLGIDTATPQANLHVAGDGLFTGNLTISGNLIVTNAQSIVTDQLFVGGNDIVLIANNTGAPSVNASITVNRGTSPNAYILWDESVNEWLIYEGEGDAGHILSSSKTANSWLVYDSFDAYEKESYPIGANLANSINEHAKAAYTTANVALTSALSAFLHANSAYESQNVTGTYANNAYLHANSAYESQNVTGTYANAAFLQANSAYESQNVTGTYANNAYIHANAAFIKANSAYESQNVTGTYANAAFLQANSAYESQNVTGTYANNAYVHANSAYESQNTTGVYANAAFLHANSAYESQNVTGTYANAAFLQANSAYESQNVTGTYANNAYIHANSAYDSQNTTGTYANAAFLQANSAYESQNVTGTYANNAYLHANSAYDSQNVTGTYANAAFLQANSAYESQNTTGVYANSAFLKTNSAYQHANSAYDSQNVTGVYANSAFAHANDSFLNSNSAYTHANAAFVKANAAMFSITPNVSEIWVNTSTGNVQIGLANVNNNIGTWGGNEAIPVINVDGHGRILSVSNTTISVPPGTYIFPNTDQLTTNANFGNVLIGLANVNSNIGTFGSQFAVPTLTVDGYGRVRDITNTTISIPQGTYIVNSNLITSNSSTGNVVLGLAESGVTSGTYGGLGKTPVVTVDEYGRVTFAANVESSVNTLSTIIRASYTATAGQTAFTTSGSFTNGYADVYINGIKLSSADYSQNGSLGQVIINSPTLLDGDVVDIQTATTYIVNSNTSYDKVVFTATAGQTTFNTSYNVGNINVYLNGLRLKKDTDYTANNGTSVVFPIPLELDDVVEIEKIASAYINVLNPTFATRNTITVTANGDSTFVVGGGYRVGSVDVFMNGIKLNVPGDVTASDGSTINILTSSTEVGDIIEVVGVGADYVPANALSINGGTIYGDLTVTQNLTANHANVNSLHFADGTSMTTAAFGAGGGGGITWKIASANTTANSGEGVLVDTTSANVHITLNASPMLGNTVRIVDMTGNFGINNCIVERNGQKIMGLNENLVISSNNAGIGLVFSNATHGWRIIENP